MILFFLYILPTILSIFFVFSVSNSLDEAIAGILGSFVPIFNLYIGYGWVISLFFK